MKPLIAERRREIRRAAQGAVRLLVDDPVPHEVHGELMDLSEGGFRAAHSDSGLHPGQEVGFCHPAAEGNARVVWIRILPERVESGVLVL